MIRARLWRNGDKRFTGFEISGHAGYADEGSDIVCAAVSILATTCANSLESVCGIQPAVDGGEDGYLKVMLPPQMTEGQLHDAQVILATLRQGLSDLTASFPKFVRLSIENGGKQP